MGEVKEKHLEADMANRKKVMEARAKMEADQAAARAAHLANVNGGTKEPKRPPRHIELKPVVEAAFEGMGIEQAHALRLAGQLPPEVMEARDIVSSPAHNGLQLLEFTNTSHRLVAPHDTHPLLLDANPNFWNILSDRLQPFDTVRVIASDSSWVADFIVLVCSERRVEAKMTSLITVPVMEDSTVPDWMPKGYSLIRLGADSQRPGWAVKRLSDGLLMLQSGVPFKEPEDARRFILDHALFKAPEVVQYFP